MLPTGNMNKSKAHAPNEGTINLSPCRRGHSRRRTRKDWLENDGDTNTKFLVDVERRRNLALLCRCLLVVCCVGGDNRVVYVCGNIEKDGEGMRESAKTDRDLPAKNKKKERGNLLTVRG